MHQGRVQSIAGFHWRHVGKIRYTIFCMRGSISREWDFLAGVTRNLMRPGPPPRMWVGTHAVLLVSWFALCAACYLAGEARGNYHMYFEENTPGTFGSTGLLATAGLVSVMLASRVVLRGGGSPVGAVLLRALLVALMAGLGLVFSIYLFDVYGYPDPAIHFFRDGRSGSDILWLLFGGAAALILASWPWLGRTPLARFWLLFGAMLCFAALDDLLMFHEHMGKVIANWLDLPRGQGNWWRRHMNDFLAAGYWPVIALLAFLHRRELARLKWMIYSLALASLAYAASVFCDFSHLGAFKEESLKLLAGTLILGAMLEAYRETPETPGKLRGRTSLLTPGSDLVI